MGLISRSEFPSYFSNLQTFSEKRGVKNLFTKKNPQNFCNQKFPPKKFIFPPFFRHPGIPSRELPPQPPKRQLQVWLVVHQSRTTASVDPNPPPAPACDFSPAGVWFPENVFDFLEIPRNSYHFFLKATGWLGFLGGNLFKLMETNSNGCFPGDDYFPNVAGFWAGAFQVRGVEIKKMLVISLRIMSNMQSVFDIVLQQTRILKKNLWTQWVAFNYKVRAKRWLYSRRTVSMMIQWSVASLCFKIHQLHILENWIEYLSQNKVR